MGSRQARGLWRRHPRHGRGADGAVAARHRALRPLTLALALAFAAPAAGQAPLGLSDCAEADGLRLCSGLVAARDGVPLDATVALPAGASGPLPLVVLIHGFGNSRHEYLNPDDHAYTGNVQEWARDGYAVLAYTARGLWGSCGTPDARLAGAAACASGYIHLADVRWEVRDTQELIGRLVDEGVADPARLAVTGDSYGGGQSLMLAALSDRVMELDGTLAPWRSPKGTPLRLAAAAPVIPWSDLLAAVAPNGTPDTRGVVDRGAFRAPIGVFKLSVANAIAAAAQFATGPGQPVGEPFVPGRPMGFLAPPGVDREADVLGWVARADRGEPYDDAELLAIVELIERYHSAYQIDSSSPPPPLLLASGFTDDLFPVGETVRFATRTRAEHPDVPLSLVVGDFGHQRSSQKPAARDALLAAIHDWFDHHVRGIGPAPPTGATATTQTCPRDAPIEGPFRAASFTALAQGEVAGRWAEPQDVASSGGDPATGRALDPVSGGGDACVAVSSAKAPGTAVYELPPAGAGGYVLLGAPRIAATLAGVQPGITQLAARLWDVAPEGGTQTLVARGAFRPDANGPHEWDLFPGAWRFAEGHVAKLELVGNDAPFLRASNGTFTTSVQSLDLRLPIRAETASAAPVGGPVRPRVRLRRRCTPKGLRITATVTGARVRHVVFRAPGGRATRDRRPPYRRVVTGGAQRVRVRVALRDGRTLKTSIRVRRCTGKGRS